MLLSDCKLIELPKISDPRGNLSFIEENNHIPYEIKRVFFLYDVPGGESRAGHALKTCNQFVIAASGSFNITLDDGQNKQTFHLNRSHFGLHIPPLLWREIDNFSSGSVCMVLASEFYNEKDYYRKYDDFLKAVNNAHK